MILHIKHMVSLRCIMMVKSELDKLHLSYSSVELGSVNLIKDIVPDEQKNLAKNLSLSGLEIIEDKKSILVEKVKTLIIEMVHYNEELPYINYSEYISKKLGYDYGYLANIFSEEKGITIQHFIIKHKIEKVKELLNYDELTLTEISYQLKYSSVGHLSYQFKKTTGISPSNYRDQKKNIRIKLEDL
ncbi:helix-turn-helix domain-containing protein [Zhouia sp. PK063]|uniref:helix-turn-helix domain-containing protein n=1 Tax=Zhouia sp. PK063 TaxID=3373602 RepID=UPI0037A81075